MDPRRQKLEQAKQKRLELEKLRNQGVTNTSGSTNSETSSTTSTTTASRPTLTNTAKVDQLLKELNKTNPADIDFDRIKENTLSMRNQMAKYKSDSLTISKTIDESLIGRSPEVYEEGVQCDYEKDNAYDSDDDNNKVKPKENARRSIMATSSLSKGASKIIPSTSGKKPVEPQNSNFLFEESKTEGESTVNTHTVNQHVAKPKNFQTEDMRRQIMSSTELTDFLGSQSKYIERALGEKEIYDMFKTYYDEDDEQNMELSKRSWVSPVMDFYEENTCSGRAVTSLEWSLKHPELMLAAYSKSEEFNLNQSNGLIHLWSLALRKSPEFTFSCQTEVTAAIFHKFNPKLVIGATYTGQILIWDTRGKALPVQKTPPGGKFHSHPIYCLGVTGTTNANNIISVSTDGSLCTWSMNNLSKPNKNILLKVKKRKQVDNLTSSTTSMERNTNPEEIGAICMATQENESNNVFIGSDDSDIYQAYVHQGNDNMENIVEVYRKHTGPIHSLDMHPGDSHKNSNFSHLFLSCSADWTVNLWSKNFSDAPIMTFDVNEDYVYDTKWHPTNPSLFASIDGLGKLDFWDLNKDVEVPVFRYDVGKNALNKLSWSQDGKRLALGDILGKVSVFNIEKELYNSKIEDSIKFEKVVSMAKNNKKGY